MIEYVKGKILNKILKKDKITKKAFMILITLAKGLDWYRKFVDIKANFKNLNMNTNKLPTIIPKHN